MSNIQSISDNKIQYDATEYKHKICAGLHCNNVPTHYLKIVLIKKSGWFCNSCKRALEDDNLLESDLAIDVKIGTDGLKTMYLDKDK
jgi:hypothetical protein